jgi:hypothetical protein
VGDRSARTAVPLTPRARGGRCSFALHFSGLFEQYLKALEQAEEVRNPPLGK